MRNYKGNDVDKFYRFFTQFGVIPKVKTETDGRKTIILRVESHDDKEVATLSNKILGYTNCYTEFLFDFNGKFVGIGLFQDIGS